MKKKVLLILPLFVASSAWAAPRSWKQARAIASLEAARIGVALGEKSLSAARGLGQTAQEGACYYVFDGDNDKGFLIVSGDDLMPDIVGYSTDGTLSDGQTPPGMAALLRDYDALVKAVRSGDKAALRCVEEAKALRAENSGVAVAPLLGQIVWSQRAPFNDKCPAYSDTAKCLTGCVATAMAQVMAYYKYPSSLQADIPAYTTQTERYDMPAIQKGVAYDWDSMLPDYGAAGGYTAKQAEAVATLMLHCGCAVAMNYGSTSGATLFGPELVDFFGYDKELVQDVGRHRFTLKQWTDIIDRELQEKRPVLFSANGAPGGHEFVCDGADGKGLYHINWGWGGLKNNYFDIAILNPDKPSNPGDDTEGFTRNCSMLIGITPDNGRVDEPLVGAKAPVDIYNYDMEHPNQLTWIQSKRSGTGESFVGKITTTFSKSGDEDFSGYVAVGTKDAAGQYVALVSTACTLTARSEALLTGEFKYPFPVGTSELYFLYSSDNKTWEPCCLTENTPYLLTATETEIKTEPSPFTITASFAGDLKCDENSKVALEITNNLAEEFNGLIILSMVSTKNPGRYMKAGSFYLSIPAGQTIVKTPTIQPDMEGSAKLCVMDVLDQVLAEFDCYVADETTSLPTVTRLDEDGLSVAGGKGCVTAESAEARVLDVYNASGQKVAHLSLRAGEKQTLALPSGIYIIDGRKVAVR